MMRLLADYLADLSETFGRGWNRFWFEASDPFPLAVIRVLTGLVAVYWHATLFPDLATFFAADGWLPVDAVRQVETAAGAYPTFFNSLSYLNGLSGPTELQVAHALGLLVLAAFTLGLFTRITSVLGLVVVLSTIHRAPMLTSQFEPVLTFVMFYLCLGPSGACLSIDRLWAARKSRPGQVERADACNTPSVAARLCIRLIQVHLALFYAVLALSKLSAEVWWRGTAFWWLITRPESRLVDLTPLQKIPQLINLWTHAEVLFELVFPILIWNRHARPLLLMVAPVFWGLYALATGQTLFAAIMLIGNLAFIPGHVLRELSGAAARRRRGVAAEPVTIG